MSEYREDVVKIPRSAKLTPQGFLSIDDARVARVGVQVYFKDGKTVRELRLPEDVKASVDSFRNSLLTLDHPRELVTIDNAPKYQKGFVPDCNYSQDGWVRAKLHLTDKDAVNAAIATHRQLSCGYTCDLEPVSGVWKDDLGVMGEKGKEYEYDCIQRNIQGNHIALVERARAGDNARFDSDESDVTIKVDSDSKRRKSMTVKSIKTYTITDSQTGKQEKFEINTDDAEDVIPVLDRFQSQLDKERNLCMAMMVVQSEYDSLKPKYDALESEKTVLVAKLEQAEKAKTDSVDLKPLIASYVKTFEIVKDSFKEDEIDLFTLDEQGLKKAYLSKKYPDEKFDDFSTQRLDDFWNYHHKYFSTASYGQETKERLDSLKPDEFKADSVRGDVFDRSKKLIKVGG